MIFLGKPNRKDVCTNIDVAPCTPIRSRGSRPTSLSWAQYGVVTLAATSGLLGRTSGQLISSSNLENGSNGQKLERLKGLLPPFQPGDTSSGLVTHREVKQSLPPSFVVDSSISYGFTTLKKTLIQNNMIETSVSGFRSRADAPSLGGSLISTRNFSSQDNAQAKSKSLITSQLQGCIASYYSAPVSIEGQLFHAIADTGSSAFGIASSKCTDCDNVGSKYKPGSLSKQDGQEIEVTYGSGSWFGDVTYAPVSFAGVPRKNVAFGAIYNQTKIVGANKCGKGGPPYQGIMGLSGWQGSFLGSDGWLAKTNSSFSYPAITFGLCDQGGAIYVGGYPANNAASPFVFTPMVSASETQLIAVKIKSLLVGKNQVSANSKDFGFAFVDTGTNAVLLPAGVFSAVVSKISQNSQGKIPQNFFDKITCKTFDNTTIDDLNAIAPSLTFSFLNSSISSSITVPATSSYLFTQESGDNGLEVCSLLRSSGSGNPYTILGSAMMRNLLTVFDYKERQVGFATSKDVC